jgi:Sulfotransferase family
MGETGETQRVLMIGGAMRSGTTVIHRALCTAANSNPYVSESWFLRDLLAMYSFRLARFEIMGADQFRSRADYVGLVADDVERYLRLVSTRHSDPEVLILKHPELIRYFVELAALAPRMSFLAIVRDPRDVVASMKAVRARNERDRSPGPLAGIRSLEGLCHFYASHYVGMLDSAESFEGRLQIVRYEDAMRRPEEVIAAIGDFCGARYDLKAAVEFQEAHAASPTFDKDQRMQDPFARAFWSDLYTRKLSEERIGTFAEQLSPAEIAEIENRLAFLGTRFDYWR